MQSFTFHLLPILSNTKCVEHLSLESKFIANYFEEYNYGKALVITVPASTTDDVTSNKIFPPTLFLNGEWCLYSTGRV
jgi:hypothetical protein